MSSPADDEKPHHGLGVQDSVPAGTSPFQSGISMPGTATARWLERPSLEYQHAFDLCATEVRRAGGPAAVLASSPFYARELLKRLDGIEAQLVPLGDWSPLPVGFGTLLGPELELPDSQTLQRAERGVKTAVWATPDTKSGRQVLDRLGSMLLPRGGLYVIVSGWLARFLPEWQAGDGLRSERPAGLRRTTRWLRQAGFIVEAQYGFHGPASTVWGLASRLMSRLGRLDWSDRCHFRMRAKYVVGGWQAIWTPVSVSVARRQ
jgi:hypothetical protein